MKKKAVILIAEANARYFAAKSQNTMSDKDIWDAINPNSIWDELRKLGFKFIPYVSTDTEEWLWRMNEWLVTELS